MTIRRARRNIRRASGDISTTGGIATGIVVGTGLGVVGAGLGYLSGMGTEYIASTREFQDLFQSIGDIGKAANYGAEASKYIFATTGGLYGFGRGLSNIPNYRNNFRDWMRRTF